MTKCPFCKKEFKLVGKKKTLEQRKKMRFANAWKYTDEILEKYNSGCPLIQLAREYNSDKRIIRNVLKEKGIKRFRGRKGIRAWNKGLTQFTDKRILKWSGKNSPNWRGGKNFIVRIRRCSKYIQWRNEVFARDNYTCQLCNKRGGDLEADHCPTMFSTLIDKNKIKSYEDALKCQELWNLANGRTLCKTCHKKTLIVQV